MADDAAGSHQSFPGMPHFDPRGRAVMVDVGGKPETERVAAARGSISLSAEAFARVAAGTAAKGDVLGVARIAGIGGAKRTSDLIPLCHPLLVGSVAINFDIRDDWVEVESQVDTVDRTGVEMEALTACAVAALTIYDMCKSADRSMVVGELALWEKTGGRSGVWRRPAGSIGEPLVNTPHPVAGGAGDDGLDARIDDILAEGADDVDRDA